jgi:hypothetical protein
LPGEDVAFLTAYAQQHGATVSEVVTSLVGALKRPPGLPIHPEAEGLTGLIPPDLDVRGTYLEGVIRKHR